MLEYGHPQPEPVRSSTRKKRSASEADPDIRTEQRRAQKSLRSISKRAAGEERDFVPKTQEQAREDILARLSGVADWQNDADPLEDFEENDASDMEGASEQGERENTEDSSKKKGKGKSYSAQHYAALGLFSLESLTEILQARRRRKSESSK